MRVLEKNRRVQCGVFAISLLFIATDVSLGSELSPREMRVWTQLYHDLNPDGNVHWPEGGPRAWARIEQERLEPIVAAILRGERKDIPWNYALHIAAPLMPTQAIRDEVYARMESTFSEKLAAKVPLEAREHGLLSTMLSVLAAGKDNRAIPALNEALQRDEYPYRIGRKYILAIRSVGNATSLQALEGMPLRQTNEIIDRMAALTERIIHARIEGEVFPPPTAPEELRKLISNFLSALEDRNVEGFKECFPGQVRELMTEKKMAEFLDRKDGQPPLTAIRVAFDRSERVDIDRENLQAKLVCDEDYVVEFIYEVDGWKVMNVRPLRTPRADPPPPVAYPDNKDTKRIFIGKPGKESGQH